MHSSSRVSFTHHPATVGETYAQHFQTAAGFAIRMIGGGLACLVHAIFPFLFESTGSSAIRSLHERMILHRSRVAHSTCRVGEVSGQIEDDAVSGGRLCTRASS